MSDYCHVDKRMHSAGVVEKKIQDDPHIFIAFSKNDGDDVGVEVCQLIVVI